MVSNFGIDFCMNSGAKKIFDDIFAIPTRKNIPWADIESLLLSVGATRTEGRGSRVKFELNGVTTLFHRPHNPKTARPYQVEAAREFLTKCGVGNE